MSPRRQRRRSPQFSADSMGPVFFDARGEYFDLEWLDLPTDLLADVLAWNEDYQ